MKKKNGNGKKTEGTEVDLAHTNAAHLPRQSREQGVLPLQGFIDPFGVSKARAAPFTVSLAVDPRTSPTRCRRKLIAPVEWAVILDPTFVF
ncbi:MAG: hypothetical protein LBH31_09760 [Burkholderiaceae bacterium]|nr:hypothetical protein [Burkholderiaceae bacterium]